MKRRVSKDVRSDRDTLLRHARTRARKQAAFLARLVSFPDLATVTAEEKKALLAEARGSGFRCVTAVERILWPILCHTHEVARPIVEGVLQEKEVSLQPLGERERTRVFVTKAGCLMQTHDTAWLNEEMLLHLWHLLHGPSCPFRRCPWCKTAVFSPVGRQKYCSRRCTSQANEAKRKGTRREYMRDLMRKKREREKRRTATAQRAKK